MLAFRFSRQSLLKRVSVPQLQLRTMFDSTKLPAGEFEERYGRLPDHGETIWSDLVAEGVTAPEGKSHMTNLTFQALGDNKVLTSDLSGSLDKMNFTNMSEVQARTVLPALKGEHMLVKAKTGTGKTAAFCIPALQRARDAKIVDGVQGLKSLVISPTRDLAQQTLAFLKQVTKKGPLRDLTVAEAVGGTSVRNLLAETVNDYDGGADFLVATPGRLLFLLKDPGAAEYFANIDSVILDEADTLLDQGFEADLCEIVRLISTYTKDPYQRNFYSATLDDRVKRFAIKNCQGRVRVVDAVGKESPAQDLVEQRFVKVEKLGDMLAVMAQDMARDAEETLPKEPFKAIVFCPTKRLTEVNHAVLKQLVYDNKDGLFGCEPRNVFSLHSDMTQKGRLRAAENFRNTPHAILVTSDVAARGMDFPNVTHVYHYGVTNQFEPYVHRMGRCGRNGANGVSTMYMMEHSKWYLTMLRKNKMLDNEDKIKILEEEPDAKMQEEVNTAAKAVFGNGRDKKPNGHDVERIASAASSFMGYYNSCSPDMRPNDKPSQIFQSFVSLCRSLGMEGNLNFAMLDRSSMFSQNFGISPKEISRVAIPRREAVRDSISESLFGVNAEDIDYADMTSAAMKARARNDKFRNNGRGGRGGFRGNNDRGNFRNNDRGNFRNNDRDGYIDRDNFRGNDRGNFRGNKRFSNDRNDRNDRRNDRGNDREGSWGKREY
ncbi:ATP-dependent RNA helicase [Yarrowia sp. B02]|nr:ATP-dependent RNA helicase [Yarrowia sp. B02]